MGGRRNGSLHQLDLVLYGVPTGRHVTESSRSKVLASFLRFGRANSLPKAVFGCEIGFEQGDYFFYSFK